MKKLATLVATIFSFIYIDLNVIRKNRHINYVTTEISTTLTTKKKRLKQKQKRYNNSKYKQKKKYRQKFCKNYNSESKDHRYSNQRSIRRMYRNT